MEEKELVQVEENEETVEERPTDVEVQTTFNEDSIDLLCEEAKVENEEKEGE